MKNLSIDEQLLNDAWRIGGLETREATIKQALEEYILRRRQTGIAEVFGRIEWDSTYDYKEQRRRP